MERLLSAAGANLGRGQEKNMQRTAFARGGIARPSSSGQGGAQSRLPWSGGVLRAWAQAKDGEE